MTSDLSRFDRDPDALAWARAKVADLEDRYRRLEGAAKAERLVAVAFRLHWIAGDLRTELIGTGEGPLAAFDERRAGLSPAVDGETG